MTQVSAELKAHYPKAYGMWAGLPNGHKPDYTRCCHGVQGPNSWYTETQCTLRNGNGPDGAYCKVHDPAAVANREQASKDRYTKKRRDENLLFTRKILRVLKAIEAGHNDPRALAKETLDHYRSQDWWDEDAL